MQKGAQLHRGVPISTAHPSVTSGSDCAPLYTGRRREGARGMLKIPEESDAMWKEEKDTGEASRASDTNRSQRRRSQPALIRGEYTGRLRPRLSHAWDILIARCGVFVVASRQSVPIPVLGGWHCDAQRGNKWTTVRRGVVQYRVDLALGDRNSSR